MENKNYRFKCEIVDEDTGEVIVTANTYISSHITELGECESVDMEVGSLLRAFKKLITNFNSNK